MSAQERDILVIEPAAKKRLHTCMIVAETPRRRSEHHRPYIIGRVKNCRNVIVVLGTGHKLTVARERGLRKVGLSGSGYQWTELSGE
jgi:hypothetical protein